MYKEIQFQAVHNSIHLRSKIKKFPVFVLFYLNNTFRLLFCYTRLKQC